MTTMGDENRAVVIVKINHELKDSDFIQGKVIICMCGILQVWVALTVGK